MAFLKPILKQSIWGKFAAKGWENIAVAGTNYLEVYENQSSRGQSVKISSYGSGDAKSDTWLLTPEIDHTRLTQPELQFSTSTIYPNMSSLTVYLVWGWTASTPLEEVSKELLKERIAHRGDDNNHWIPSGPIPLPTTKGPLRIGFRYQGSEKSNADSTLELDDLVIMEAGPVVN